MNSPELDWRPVLRVQHLFLQPAEPADPTAEVSKSAQNLWDSFVAAWPRLGIAAVVLALGFGAARTVRWAARRTFLRRHTESFANVMSKLASWVVGFSVALLAITVTFPSVKPVDLLAGLGFFSVAVGFAFQDILENLLSGVLLLFRQPFQSGDQIEVNGIEGTVLGITIRETKLKTYDGQMMIIPNRDVYKSAIRVQTAFDTRRMSFTVGVSYEDDLNEARAVMRDAVASLAAVHEEPQPEAIIAELGVSTVNIDVRFWTDSRQLDARMVLDEAIAAVKVAVDDAGIEMPCDIVALQGTTSFQAALIGGTVTDSGSLVEKGSQV